MKGALGETVDVQSAVSGVSCGIEVPEGQRIGLLLYRRDGVWTSGLCLQLPPGQLREAARPLPAPDGSGAAAFLVGGRYDDVRVLALDALGRTLAYGRGGGSSYLFSVCDGARRAVAVGIDGDHLAVTVGELPRLRLLREIRLPLGLAFSPGAILCRDPDAYEVVVFATNVGGARAVSSRLFTIRGSRISIVRRGSAYACAFGRSQALVNKGQLGRDLVSVDLNGGKQRALARLPAGTGPLMPSPDGKRLAGVAYGAPIGVSPPPSRVVLVDLTRRQPAVRTAPLSDPNVTGKAVWLDRKRLAFIPSAGNAEEARTYDTSLRELGRLRGWDAYDATVSRGVVYGVTYGGALVSARLPSGPVERVRDLPGPETYGIAAVPRRAQAARRSTLPAGVALPVAVLSLAVLLISFRGRRRRLPGLGRARGSRVPSGRRPAGS